MKLENLLEQIPEGYTSVDREKISRAYHFAERYYGDKVRISGEPFTIHMTSVAAILADMHAATSAVVAGLLHDITEDTNCKLEDVRQEFGDEVALLVEGVTRLKHLPRLVDYDASLDQPVEEPSDSGARSRKKELINETLRKTFMAMSEDIRVVVIKLADRLHNMRTLGYLPEVKRRRIAQETLDIFAPLANRLGLWQIKWELEDLGFRHTNPEKYKEIAENLAERRVDRERQIQNIIQNLQSLLAKAGVTAEISGRPKHIYSIYKKMIEKGKPFEMVRDLRGVRLIVPDIPACYTSLGLIHTHWRPIPNEFDDYIAAPKNNFYRSLHTAIIYDDGKPLEVQIRTLEMHHDAEFGVAAHWRYKEKGARDVDYQNRINGLRSLIDWRQDVQDAQQFMEGMRTDVFQDRVYVFTPRGDIIDLPAGSTPIDFAYHVHTDVGNRCRGAKINGKLVTLDYPLKTGDQVEILTAKQGGPSRDWLNPSLGMVKTQRAKSKINQWFKWQDRSQNIAQGKILLEKEFRRLGITLTDLSDIAHQFDFQSVDDLYVAIGCGDLPLGRVINKIAEAPALSQSDILAISRPVTEETSHDAVMVLGLKGLATTIARCCRPVPGDPIVGYITRGRGAAIHHQDCPNVQRVKERERIIVVSWGIPKKTYAVPIQIKAYDRQGLIVDITNILHNDGINLIKVDLKVTRGQAIINLTVEIGDIQQLSRILARIENLPNVMEAHRLKPG